MSEKGDRIKLIYFPWQNKLVILILYGFVFFTMGRFMQSIAVLFVVTFFFSVLFGTVLTSLGEKSAGQYAFLAFVCDFTRAVLFPFVSGVGCGL